ncbi:response regulator transcription factor [Gluconacetobacter azotocaptans]|uniref:response regulator transcription factor n=1 Tax=Gluconacetobacter azotocaptans TaxID=142834 RepID=UPI00195D8E19|nr:response regulator [Gluconacetobacter azotocaptans]MBM9401139.1 response regulator transcription factor [Gluconacetobacter azotocaptans]
MPVLESPTTFESPVVIIVEDDTRVRKSLQCLLRSAGLPSIGYGSASELLDRPLPDSARCLICDIRLPNLNGFDLKATLEQRGESIAVIFITGHGDIPMSVRAMKGGAIDFLEKPFQDQELLDAVREALATDCRRREAVMRLKDLRARLDRLSPREREVLSGVGSGRLNKQIANDLGLSEITVKLHRANLMRKMKAGSFAELVRIIQIIETGAVPDHTRV